MNPHIHITIFMDLISTIVKEGKKPKRITDKAKPQKESK